MESDSPENDCHTISSQRAPSPDLFSSEDEDTYKTDDYPNQSIPPSPAKAVPSVEKNLVLELESARLQRLMTLLQGVPPPPSVTIPQISLNEVLKRLRENADQMVAPSNNEEPVSSLWKPNASNKEVLDAKWPEIKGIVYHDVHFNTCTASEDVEHISLKLHERFIGAETSSWCSGVTSVLPSNTRQRQRRSLGNASPGCRLSHLARRRQTFSSANLAQLSSVAGSGTAGGAPVAGSSLSGSRRRLMNGGGAGQERRCIMVEIKKSDKNKRIKTNSKEAMNKLLQSGNALKAVAPVQDPVQFTKRALFQSPEEEKRAAASSSQPSASESNSIQRSKRALWPSEKDTSLNDNGKRTLDNSESSSSQRSKMHCSEDRAPYNRATRSLPFPLGQNSCGSAVGSTSNSSHSTNTQTSGINNKIGRRASDQGLPSQEYNLNVELTELHKRKLYWAITSALRSYGINNRNHSDFIRLTSDLAFHYIKVRSNMTGPPPASTSEHMLQVVSAKAAEVIQGVGAEKSGQEENLGASKVQKKEERSNKELFRDATASLNVRRSLCVNLSTSNHQLSSDKPKQTKRVPSARKSLSFDAIDPRASSGTVSDDPAEKAESKYQLDSKGIDSKWKGNGENVPLASAKRVSRSLFLSPKDDVKAAKKDACEQTCAPDNEQACLSDNQSSANKTCDEAIDTVVDHKSEDVKKASVAEISDTDERHPQTSSEVSSIPSVSAESSTLEADNEASRTSEATNLSEQLNSLDASNNLASLASKTLTKENGLLEKTNAQNVADKADSGSSESSDFVPMRVLRGTKERAARQAAVLPARRNTRKSLSLSRRELRSSSSDSTDQDHAPPCQLQEVSTSENKATDNSLNVGTSLNMDPLVVLSPLKAVLTESNTASKSAFGSPPFINDSTLTPAHSPFLGFPSKDDLNSSGGVADGSNSTAKADGTSEEGNFSQPGCIKADIEEKVITPLLEAAVLESSVCVGSGSSHSTDADLSFRGRIESLKPSNINETAIILDLGMNLSANILNMDENREKSPVLEKWAERASRSAQKSCILPENDIDAVTQDESAAGPQKPNDNTAEESILQWEESQLGEVSMCSTNMYEKFCSIFGPSSHQGNS